MSAADGVTGGSDAEHSDTAGATGAEPIDPKRAQHAQPIPEAHRDRRAIDAEGLRLRQAFEIDSDCMGGTVASKTAAEKAMRARQEALLTIEAARQAVRDLRHRSVKTVENYKGKSRLLLKSISLSAGDLATAWSDALSEYAPKAKSFQAMRAAASWWAENTLSELLSQHCATPPISATSDKWLSHVAKVGSVLEHLRIISTIDRKGLLEVSGLTAMPAVSKRASLSRLPDDWRQQMVSAAENRTCEWAVSIMALTGCRPEELVRGVSVAVEHQKAVVRILGAKTGRNAGQVWRELTIDSGTLPQSLLAAAQDCGGEVCARIGSTAALRSAIGRMGESLWPRGPRISPITFRHALAEDLRETGWTPDEMGAVLGHRVSETSSLYGRRRRPGQGRSAVNAVAIARGDVRTAVAVRALKPFNLAQIKTTRTRGAAKPSKP